MSVRDQLKNLDIPEEAKALLALQQNSLPAVDPNEFNAQLHTGTNQPKIDLTPGQQMTADSVKPRDFDIGMFHPDIDSPDKPLKGLFMTKRFNKGGVAEPNANEPKAPEGPSYDEKREAVLKELQANPPQMADGGAVDALPPPDAPQESKLSAIMKALGLGASDAVSSVLPGTQNLAKSVMPAAENAAATPGIAPAINAAIGTSLPDSAPKADTTIAAPAPDVSDVPPPVIPPVQNKAPQGSSVTQNVTPTPDPLAQLGKFDPSTVTPGLNPGDRQALASNLNANQHTYGNYLAEALAGLGDAVAARGGVQQDTLGKIFALQTQQRQEALDNFDKARQAAVEHFTMKNQADQRIIENLKARNEMIVSPAVAQMIGHPNLAGKPLNQADLVIKTDAMKYDFANKMTERKQSALKNSADEIDKAVAHGGMFGTQKMLDPQSRLRMIHAQAIKNDPEAFGYSVHEGK